MGAEKQNNELGGLTPIPYAIRKKDPDPANRADCARLTFTGCACYGLHGARGSSRTVLRNNCIDVLFDTNKHKAAHIHVVYQGDEAVYSIPAGKLLEGRLPPAKAKLARAWIEIHKEELMADWQLAATGNPVFKIDPLK